MARKQHRCGPGSFRKRTTRPWGERRRGRCGVGLQRGAGSPRAHPAQRAPSRSACRLRQGSRKAQLARRQGRTRHLHRGVRIKRDCSNGLLMSWRAGALQFATESLSTSSCCRQRLGTPPAFTQVSCVSSRPRLGQCGTLHTPLAHHTHDAPTAWRRSWRPNRVKVHMLGHVTQHSLTKMSCTRTRGVADIGL